jgi:murein DD-endopeptidase MepM/ murein hydrolase activator NlpD
MKSKNENPHYPLDNMLVYQEFGHLGHVVADFKVPVGTLVYAILNGVVTMTCQDSKTYGRFVTILHGDGHESWYAHLSKTLVHKGDIVQGGTIIGLSGGAVGADGAGQTTGWHLHFEVRVPGHLDHNKYNVDPIKYILSYMIE